MFPGVVISAVLLFWMLSSSSSKSGSKPPTDKGDAVAKIVAGNGDYIIIQKDAKKS
ncbi:MAG: hypothetical protein AAFU71_04035 [Cyanobacteria bacterium J06632_22]